MQVLIELVVGKHPGALEIRRSWSTVPVQLAPSYCIQKDHLAEATLALKAMDLYQTHLF